MNKKDLSITPKQKINNLRELLLRSKGHINDLMPGNAERLIRIGLGAVSRNPLLLECTPASIVKCLLLSAEIGLEPDTPLNHAYLVPFYNSKIGAREAQFIPGYQGLVDLAMRSGQIQSIETRLVYKGELFEVEYGMHPKLIHRPNFDSKRLDEDVLYVYSIARMVNGGILFEVMNRNEIEAVRASSKAKDSGTWVNYWGMQARKTVFKRLNKYLPTSPSLARAIQLDTQTEMAEEQKPNIEGLDYDILDEANGENKPAENKTEKLVNKIEKQKKKDLVKNGDNSPKNPDLPF